MTEEQDSLGKFLSGEGPVFGRQAEREQFERILVDSASQGTTVLVVGPVGIGKSAVLRLFEQASREHPDVEAWTRRYSLTDADSPGSFALRVLEDMFLIRRTVQGLQTSGPDWRQEIAALVGPDGADEVVGAFARSELRPAWEQLIDLCRLVSERSDANRRFVILVDPIKYLKADEAGVWTAVASKLPPKFVLVIAQRPDGVLVRDDQLAGANVVRVPTPQLGPLDEAAIDEIVQSVSPPMGYSPELLARAVAPCGGNPSLLFEALSALRRGTPVDRLVGDPVRGIMKLRFYAAHDETLHHVPIGYAPPGAVGVGVGPQFDHLLRVLDRKKLTIIVCLLVILGMGVFATVCAILTQRWEVVTASGVVTLALFTWPVTQLIRLYNEERPLRIIHALLPLADEEQIRIEVIALIRKMIDAIT